jgi:O-Antigen ligase
MRNWVLVGCATALIGLPTVLAFFSGGFFDEPRIVAAIGVWAIVGAVALLAPRPLPVSIPGRLALIGLLLLCGWTALSITWAPLGGRVQDDLQRLSLYAGFFLACIALLRPPGARRVLEPAVALGAFVVVGYGLSERLLPGIIELDRSTTSAGRLEQPLTYWNATGIVAAVGLILAIRVAGDPERPRWLRAALAAVGVTLGLGVYLTFARGALAAVAVGLFFLLVLAPAAGTQLRAAVAIVVPATLAALVSNGLPTVKSLEGRDAGEGLLMLATLALLSLGALHITLRAPKRQDPRPGRKVSRPAAVLGAAGVVLVVASVTLAAFEGKPESASPSPGATPARLASIDTNRYRYWEVAGKTFAEHPLIGAGSGAFVVDWLKVEDRVDASGDAHSLYLETAAELGLVGLAPLLLFLGGTSAAVVRLYRRNPGAATGLAAGLAAWAFHAGLDWDWEMPAATLPALLLAAGAIAWSEEEALRAASSEGDRREGEDRVRGTSTEGAVTAAS